MSNTQAGTVARNDLHIQLLGGFSVAIGGKSIPKEQWKSRRARNLLELLALSPGHRLHREQVIDALWPEADQAAAANSFHQLLYTVRQGLAAVDCLVLEDSILSLAGREAQPLTVDVEQFEAAAVRAKRSTDPEVFQTALALYRGDLLPDDLYEQWTIQPREALRRAYLGLLLDLARLHEARQEYAPGIAVLQQLLATDRSHEEAQATLMRLYAWSGQRQQALRQYQILREALRAELEAEPSQATDQLYKAIQSGHFEAPAAQGSQPGVATRLQNLPAQMTSFIGREVEIAEVSQRINDNRLVTMTGVGGTGKTRLALQVAERIQDRFPNGVWLVELALLSNPRLVAPAVANALGIRESPDISSEDQLLHYLRARALLLVLDNCEHLVEACAVLAGRLLASCPNLRILATSREGLEVAGEALYPVLPLPYPVGQSLPDITLLERCETVQLFVERARLVRPAFTLTPENAHAVARICQRLDGIPLALELAAVRANLLSVEQIAARLDDCFRLLAGGGRTLLPRHQTMRAALDWSYDLLSEPERALLRRLVVFAGGWSLEAAEQVCSDATIEPAGILDLLNQLVKKSMVIASIGGGAGPEIEPDQETRYRLLEPIRQYARARLEQAGEGEVLRDRHLAYFLDLADRTAWKPFQNRLSHQWKLLKHDVENLRAGLEWALGEESSPRVEDGLHFVGALLYFWGPGSLVLEGRAWARKALAMTVGQRPDCDPQRALALETYGVLIAFGTDFLEAIQPLKESIALFRACGDDWHLAKALADLALYGSSFVDPMGALVLAGESIDLARQVGDPILLAICLQSRGSINFDQGYLAGAIRDCQESLQLYLDLGDRGGACVPLVLLTGCAIQHGDPAAAFQYRKNYFRYRPELDDPGMDMFANPIWLQLAYLLDEFKQMEEIAQAMLDQCLDQMQLNTPLSLCFLGVARKRQGEYREASAFYLESLGMSQETQNYDELCMEISELAGIAAQVDQPARAARLFGAVEQMLKTIVRPMDWVIRCEYERDVAAVRRALSAEECSQAWTEGSSIALDEAIQEARTIAVELA